MAKRLTSAAKDILEQQADNLLERYGLLSNNFEQAQDTAKPLEASQDQGLEEDKRYQGTSAAREILDQNADNLLERYGETARAFNNAHENFQGQKGQG